MTIIKYAYRTPGKGFKPKINTKTASGKVPNVGYVDNPKSKSNGCPVCSVTLMNRKLYYPKLAKPNQYEDNTPEWQAHVTVNMDELAEVQEFLHDAIMERLEYEKNNTTSALAKKSDSLTWNVKCNEEEEQVHPAWSNEEVILTVKQAVSYTRKFADGTSETKDSRAPLVADASTGGLKVIDLSEADWYSGTEAHVTVAVRVAWDKINKTWRVMMSPEQVIKTKDSPFKGGARSLDIEGLDLPTADIDDPEEDYDQSSDGSDEADY